MYVERQISCIELDGLIVIPHQIRRGEGYLSFAGEIKEDTSKGPHVDFVIILIVAMQLVEDLRCTIVLSTYQSVECSTRRGEDLFTVTKV